MFAQYVNEPISRHDFVICQNNCINNSIDFTSTDWLVNRKFKVALFEAEKEIEYGEVKQIHINVLEERNDWIPVESCIRLSDYWEAVKKQSNQRVSIR